MAREKGREDGIDNMGGAMVAWCSFGELGALVSFFGLGAVHTTQWKRRSSLAGSQTSLAK